MPRQFDHQQVIRPGSYTRQTVCPHDDPCRLNVWSDIGSSKTTGFPTVTWMVDSTAMDSLLKSRICTAAPETHSVPFNPVAARNRCDRRLFRLVEPEAFTEPFIDP